VSSSERSARWLTFTFQRTASQAAPGALHSFGSQLKSTQPKRWRSSTGAKSVGANCAWISRKTALGLRASGAISEDHHLIGSVGTTMGEATRAAAITTAVGATTAVATVARSIGRRSPKAVVEGCAARSGAFSELVLGPFRMARDRRKPTRRLKKSRARCEPRPSARCVVPPRSVNLDLACRRVADQPPTVLR